MVKPADAVGPPPGYGDGVEVGGRAAVLLEDEPNTSANVVSLGTSVRRVSRAGKRDDNDDDDDEDADSVVVSVVDALLLSLAALLFPARVLTVIDCTARRRDRTPPAWESLSPSYAELLANVRAVLFLFDMD